MEKNKVDKKAEMEYINLCNEDRSTYRFDTDGFGKEEKEDWEYINKYI